MPASSNACGTCQPLSNGSADGATVSQSPCPGGTGPCPSHGRKVLALRPACASCTPATAPCALMKRVIGCHASTWRSEEHTSELQSLMRISYAVFCLKKKKNKDKTRDIH